MLVADRGEITGQREGGCVLAIQGVSVQAIAMAGVLQRGALQFQSRAGCCGAGRSQQRLRQCSRGSAAEAFVGVRTHAASTLR